jgi:hypothetical protein
MWPTSLKSVTVTGIPFAAESVTLARQCNIPSVLKRALYELVRVEGFGADNGDRGESLPRISSGDYILLLRAREKLTNIWITAAACPSNLRACASGNVECTSNKPKLRDYTLMKLIHRTGFFKDHIYDPVCGFRALIDAPWAEEGFCQYCVDKRKRVWTNEREALWKDLDLWFGLTDVST